MVSILRFLHNRRAKLKEFKRLIDERILLNRKIKIIKRELKVWDSNLLYMDGMNKKNIKL